MDDKEDRDVTLQEQLTCAYNRVLDAMADYNEFVKKNYPEYPTMIHTYRVFD